MRAFRFRELLYMSVLFVMKQMLCVCLGDGECHLSVFGSELEVKWRFVITPSFLLNK